MKLEVGMYVRLDRKQGIRRINECNEDYNTFLLDEDICDEWGDENLRLYEEDILKASHDIIDVIKAGDFLDKHCITEIKDDTCYTNDGFFIHKDDIEDLVSRIVTKEQFEEMSYKLKV